MKKRIVNVIIIICFVLLITGCRNRETTLNCAIERNQPELGRDRRDEVTLTFYRGKLTRREEIQVSDYVSKELAESVYRTIRGDSVIDYSLEGSRLTGKKDLTFEDDERTYEDMKAELEGAGWICK